MEVLIRLKNFRLTPLLALLILIANCLAFESHSYGDESRLPVIHNLGIIPLQPPRDDIPQDMERAYNAIREHIPQAARSSSKYKVANDNLISTMWDNAEGRAELADRFEIHGYLNIEMNIRDDAVTVYARLLNSKLSIYLIESENRPRSWFRKASSNALNEMTEQLIYRMFNRVPVDATVTSTQGQFVTLSGGAKQGLKAGDMVDLYHVYVSQTHPANGAWLKFTKNKQGEARIIEVLDRSSVAQLTRVKHDSSVRVGDGVSIPRMNARSHFKRLAEAKKPSATDARPIELTPLYRTDKNNELGWQPKAGDMNSSPPAKRAQYKEPDPSKGDEAPGPFADEAPKTAENDAGSGIEEDIYSTIDKAIDYAVVMIGPRLWKATGAASAAASFIPANYGGILIGRSINKDISIELGGGVFAGITKNGSFTGFNAEGEVYFHKPLNDMIQWRVGGGGGLLSLAVNEEPYGGGDLIQGFISAGVFSTKQYSASSMDWFADFKIRPLNTGQIGAKGTKRTIKSSMGTTLRAGAIMNGEPRTFEFGGMLEINSLDLSLSKSADNSKNDLTLSDLVIMGLGRLKF